MQRRVWDTARVVLWMVVGVASVGLGGCASEKSAALKPAELTEFKAAAQVHTVWRVSLGDAAGEPLQPAVLDNAVYAAAADGALVRLAPDTGKTVWRVDVGQRISSGVGSDGYTVVVATARGEVLAFGADGKPLWTAQVSSDVIAPAVVGQGLVVVRSTDQRLSAFDATSGKRKWTYQRQQPALTVRTVGGLQFVADTLVAGFPGGRLVGIALSNGAARWETAVAEPKGATEVERLADVVGPVAVNTPDVCAAAYQGRIMCAEAASGNLRWARDMPALAGVLIDGTTVYAVDARSHINAYARTTGASVWSNAQLHYRNVTAPARVGSALVVGDDQGYVHFLAPADGAFVARARIDSSAIVATPQVGAGVVVIQTQDGTVAALSVER